jgi:hypothetical protein
MGGIAGVRVAAVCGAAYLALSCCALGGACESGGAVSAWGAVWPSPGASVSLNAFLGLGACEASSRTEYSLFPYTVGSETLALALVRDWLSLSGEYQWSLLPLGVTQAVVRARALPAPWDVAEGDVLVELSVEGEARLKGDSFDSSPLRAELWARGLVTASRDLGVLDQVLLGVSLEGTLSSPGGEIWPTPGLVLSASFGPATLASRTTLSFAQGFHIASETVSLRGSWKDTGLSGEISLGLAEGGEPSVGLRVSYEFGSTPRRPFPLTDECAGGVCR